MVLLLRLGCRWRQLVALARLVSLVWAPVEASHVEWEEASTSRAEQFDSAISPTLELQEPEIFGTLRLQRDVADEGLDCQAAR